MTQSVRDSLNERAMAGGADDTSTPLDMALGGRALT